MQSRGIAEDITKVKKVTKCRDNGYKGMFLEPPTVII